MASPVFSLVVRLVQESVKSSLVASSMTWKNNPRTISCSFLVYVPLAKDIGDGTLPVKDCQIAEAHSSSGIEHLLWVVNVLVDDADEVGGETVWSLRRWRCPQRDDPPFLDVHDGDESVQGLAGVHAYNIPGICIRAWLSNCTISQSK